jgi:hypothetical protein
LGSAPRLSLHKEEIACLIPDEYISCRTRILVPSQRHGSDVLLGHLIPKDEAVVADDVLHSRLIVHVHDELLTARGGHHIRPGLVSILAFEEILHTKTIHTLF